MLNKIAELMKIVEEMVNYSPLTDLHPRYKIALRKAKSFLEENKNIEQIIGDDGK